MVLKICTEPIRTPSLFGGVPAGFDPWFQRAVMRDPALRFQSARELADELKKACEGAVTDDVQAAALATSKTEWLDTGRVGLDQSGAVRPDTGGALSRTAAPDTTQTVRTRSNAPWIFASVAVVAVAGSAAAYLVLTAPESGANDAAAAASSLLAQTTGSAPVDPAIAASTSSLALAVTPRPILQPDAGASKAAKAKEPVVAAATSTEAPTPVARRPRREPGRPSPEPARPSPPPVKAPPAPGPKPSPFDDLLKSRK
jgi:hypothetical protein